MVDLITKGGCEGTPVFMSESSAVLPTGFVSVTRSPVSLGTDSQKSKVNREISPSGGPGAITPEKADTTQLEILPIAVYEGEHGYPFVADYFKLNTPYEFIDSSMRSDLEAIDDFVKGYIKDEGKEETIASYAKTMRALEKKVGIDETTLRGLAIGKLANLAKNFRKVSDVFSKNTRRVLLRRLIKMIEQGFSSFDQDEYLLEKLGSAIK